MSGDKHFKPQPNNVPYHEAHTTAVHVSNNDATHSISNEQTNAANTARTPNVDNGNGATQSVRTNMQTTTNTDVSDHFLEMIRLLKTEILQTLDQKMSAITAQMNQLQQAQSPPQFQPQPPMPMMMFRPQMPPQILPTYPQQQYQH